MVWNDDWGGLYPWGRNLNCVGGEVAVAKMITSVEEVWDLWAGRERP